MAETIIKVDLSKSPYDNDMIHNRWHPDIPMVATVKPGDDFIIQCVDWTGGQIKNDDSAADVRDVDLSKVHFLSGPVGIEGLGPAGHVFKDTLLRHGRVELLGLGRWFTIGRHIGQSGQGVLAMPGRGFVGFKR